MSKPNTDYGLRLPADEELKSAFGSISRCVEVTGGDLPTILFYLANADRISGAPSVRKQPGELADRLYEIALTERAQAAWDAMDKPTITATAKALGIDPSVARRGLVNAGKWPVPA